MIDMSKLGWTKANIASNLEILHGEKLRLKAEIDAVYALIKATQGLCDHKRKVSYCNARDEGAHCPDCGATW